MFDPRETAKNDGIVMAGAGVFMKFPVTSIPDVSEVVVATIETKKTTAAATTERHYCACPTVKNTMEASANQISEYETQLADVQELLKASPDDAALLSLKTDLEELLELTRASLQQTLPENESPVETASAVEGSILAPVQETIPAAVAEKKKLKMVKDFDVPEHLKPLETDSEKEKNKKYRALKTLKNKWRERKKEVESAKKQQSWQSFQTKKKRQFPADSIFATQDVSRSMTEFGQRKRHK
jgi:hypothetical protein